LGAGVGCTVERHAPGFLLVVRTHHRAEICLSAYLFGCRDGALLLVNWWLSMAATAHIAMMAGHMYVNMTENATTIEQISLGSRRPKVRNPSLPPHK
jgi:hypothetical protein